MKVYLSSTLVDLEPERQAVKEALGGVCTVVESYTADERSVRASCLADVAGCDLYIAIVGLRYGVVPPGQTCSITQLEYREARDRQIPTLVFVKDEDEIKPRFHDAVTNENPRERIETFRRSLTSGADGAPRASVFKTPEDLKAHLLKAWVLRVPQQPEAERKPISGEPYPGLRAFRTDQADRFFGRDDEVDALIERLLARDQRFLALIGASGSGKSSLVYAGLFPKLQALPAAAHWLAITVIPRELGDDPFLSLASALKSQFPGVGWRAADLAQRLRDQPADVAAVAAQALRTAGPGAQILLFVDQFEEVFAHKVDAAARSAFFALLVAAVACPLLRVVISMRADFYAQWPQDEAAMALLHAGHFPVAAPGQRALAQLYERRDGEALTEAAYTQIGGVAGAIDGLAEEAVEQARRALAQEGGVLDDEAWSRLFTAIASLEEQQGSDLAVVRRRAAASELPAPVLTLAQHLVDKRLLVSSAGSDDKAAQFEVGHERVFSHWRRFQDWYARHAEDLAARRQVERAAAEWDKAGRPHILRWGWERQKPALEALRKLNHLPSAAADADFADTGIALWRALQARLPDTPLKDFLYPEPLSLIDELAAKETTHQRREEIGLRLNQLPDPRRGVGLGDDGLPDFVWIDVPGGEVTIEIDAEAEADADADADEKPERRRGSKAVPQSRFAVNAFQLARYPVTWSQYRAFLEAEDGYANPVCWEGRPREEDPGDVIWSFHNYPAVNVSWFDAMAYCRWLSARLGCDIRLPNECEWQWAAAADTGQEYPWVGDWDPERANSQEAGIGRTVAVGLYPEGRSSLDFEDMSGNVYEWCLNDRAHPARVSTDLEASRVARGGSWSGHAGGLRSSIRDVSPAGSRYDNVGFRVCRVSPIEKQATGALTTEPLKP